MLNAHLVVIYTHVVINLNWWAVKIKKKVLKDDSAFGTKKYNSSFFGLLIPTHFWWTNLHAVFCVLLFYSFLSIALGPYPSGTFFDFSPFRARIVSGLVPQENNLTDTAAIFVISKIFALSLLLSKTYSRCVHIPCTKHCFWKKHG